MKVLIADDEPIIREGLKTIIDWSSFNFTICGEAGNGVDCLNMILEYQPELVMLDIRMPKMHGLEVAQQARSHGFKGSMIILSGFSDFEYAQSAIRSGIDYYLLKPIDEDELMEAVKNIKKKIELENKASRHMNQCMEQARDVVISDIIRGKVSFTKENPMGTSIEAYASALAADSYCVVIADNGDSVDLHAFCKLLKLDKCQAGEIEAVRIHDRNVFLLKGSTVIQKMTNVVKLSAKSRTISKVNAPQYFISMGRTVHLPKDIRLSYEDAKEIVKRQFFYEKEQTIVVYPNAQASGFPQGTGTLIDIKSCVGKIFPYIESCNKEKIIETLRELQNALKSSNMMPENIKNFLTNIYVLVEKQIRSTYQQTQINFSPDETVIDRICSATKLYIIFEFLSDEFCQMAEAIADTGKNSTTDKVIRYIDKNYNKNLKLETLAELFGYNSAYLGKLFKITIGENFNSYIDRTRIANAKRMLTEENLKVYEISEKIGYTNIDYFNLKFKKYVGESPTEYRRRLGNLTTNN